MTTRRWRRRWLFIGLTALFVVVLAFVGYSSLDRPAWIYYYRVVDDRTLLLGTINGPRANVRVTNVAETAQTVTVTVSALFFQLGPSTSEGYSYESAATLKAPPRKPCGDRRQQRLACPASHLPTAVLLRSRLPVGVITFVSAMTP